MSDDAKPRCSRCKFYMGNADSGSMPCRRFPPIPISVPVNTEEGFEVRSYFPHMQPDGWCGEFKLRRLH